MTLSLPFELVDLIVSSIDEVDDGFEDGETKTSTKLVAADAGAGAGAAAAATRSHRALCLVSSMFYRCAHTRLYHTIYLDGPCGLQLLRRTLLEQPGLGAAIRNLWVSAGERQQAAVHSAGTRRPSKEGLLVGGDSSLVKETFWNSMSRIQEAAWVTTDYDTGGFKIGHAISVQEQTVRDEASKLDVKATRLLHYYLVAPSLEPWAYTLLRSIAQDQHGGILTSVTITLYPGLVIDDDMFEYLLRRILKLLTPIQNPSSASAALSKLTILVGHDSVALGSRLTRMDRSRTISQAARRIGDDRLVVEGAQGFAFGLPSGKGLQEDVVEYTRAGWRSRISSRGKSSEKCKSSSSKVL